MDSLSVTIDRCRICGSTAIDPVLDLGRQPLANSLRADKAEVLPECPLVICRCNECGTVQLTETVSPELLFKHYVWVTGTSDGARAYSQIFCDRLVARSRPGRLFVLEIASNDGTFLQRFAERGDRVLGVDPAANIAAIAQRSGIPTLPEFFDLDVANRIVERDGMADAVFARNVIPHVANTNGVVGGLARCLSADGTGAIEFHRADVILSELHYDSIYHEHLYYHSMHSMSVLLARFGLFPFDVATSPISGGSLVVYFSKTQRPRSGALDAMIEDERRLGIAGAEPWRSFAARCERHRDQLKALVDAAVAKGQRVIGYGASARSSTLLNYCGIGRDQLLAIADKSALKHGRYSPGTAIPIVAPAAAFAEPPDVVLLLAWNFRDEILAQIRAEHGWRGEVILPLPGDPAVITLS